MKDASKQGDEEMETRRIVAMEKMLRKARQQVFDKPSRGKAIKWLKKQLEPTWKARRDALEPPVGSRDHHNFMM